MEIQHNPDPCLTIDSTLEHEGFVTEMLKRCAEANGRDVANQTLFNGSDNAPVNESAKETIVGLLDIGHSSFLKDKRSETAVLLKRARNAKTKGQLRAVVTAAKTLLG